MTKMDNSIDGNQVGEKILPLLVVDQPQWQHVLPICYGLDQTHTIGLDKTKMNNFLRNDGKMIVAVNGGGHYVAVVGIDDSSNPPKYIVNDPNDSDGKMKTWTYSQLSTGHTMVFHIAPKGKTVDECLKAKTVQV